jgi:hypothetical protein
VAAKEILARDVPKLDSPLAARARRLVTPDRGRDHPTGDVGGARRARRPSALPDGSATDLSGLAVALSDLRRLLGEDPERFEKVAATVAEALEGLAAPADDALASILGQVAARFREAARARRLPSLEELGTGPVAQEHPHPHVQAYADLGSMAGGAGLEELSAHVARLVEDAIAGGP